MFRVVRLAFLLSLATLLFAQTGFDLGWIDRSVSPCDDFYQYACGLWQEKNPIPPDQTRWSRFNELLDRNQATLRQILEQSAEPRSSRSPIEQKIGDYYSSCMDAANINQLGLEPLTPEMERIESISDVAGMADVVARLHRMGVGAMFNFTSSPDFTAGE